MPKTRLDFIINGYYGYGMTEAQRVHQQKVQRRRRDLKAQARGRRLSKAFSLAKSVADSDLRAPLDLTRFQLPTVAT